MNKSIKVSDCCAGFQIPSFLEHRRAQRRTESVQEWISILDGKRSQRKFLPLPSP